MNFNEGELLYRAEFKRIIGSRLSFDVDSFEVEIKTYRVERVTKKGAWIKLLVYPFDEKWISITGRFARRYEELALLALKNRTMIHKAHCSRRFEESKIKLLTVENRIREMGKTNED